MIVAVWRWRATGTGRQRLLLDDRNILEIGDARWSRWRFTEALLTIIIIEMMSWWAIWAFNRRTAGMKAELQVFLTLDRRCGVVVAVTLSVVHVATVIIQIWWWNVKYREMFYFEKAILNAWIFVSYNFIADFRVADNKTMNPFAFILQIHALLQNLHRKNEIIYTTTLFGRVETSDSWLCI